MNNRTTLNQQAFTTAFRGITVYPTGKQLVAARGVSMGARALLAELEAVQQMDDMPHQSEAVRELNAAITHAQNAQRILRKEPAAEP